MNKKNFENLLNYSIFVAFLRLADEKPLSTFLSSLISARDKTDQRWWKKPELTDEFCSQPIKSPATYYIHKFSPLTKKTSRKIVFFLCTTSIASFYHFSRNYSRHLLRSYCLYLLVSLPVIAFSTHKHTPPQSLKQKTLYLNQFCWDKRNSATVAIFIFNKVNMVKKFCSQHQHVIIFLYDMPKGLTR